MKLRRRQKRKKAQALDVVASAVKGMAELHLAQRAGKTVGKGAKSVEKGAKKASRLKGLVKSTPAKILGGAAVVGGAGALIAQRVKGGDPEPIYTPPAPAEPVAVASAPEVDAVVEAAAEAAAADAPGMHPEPKFGTAGESGVVIDLVPGDEAEAEPAIGSDDALEEAVKAAAGTEPVVDPAPASAEGDADASAAAPADADADADADAIEPPGEAGAEPAPEDDKPGPG